MKSNEKMSLALGMNYVTYRVTYRVIVHRQEYFNSAGNMLHEAEADYSIKPSMTTLWDWIATFLETH